MKWRADEDANTLWVNGECLQGRLAPQCHRSCSHPLNDLQVVHQPGLQRLGHCVVLVWLELDLALTGDLVPVAVPHARLPHSLYSARNAN